MPDLPPLRSLSSPSLITTTHSLTTRSFTKINLLGGPFNVKLYHNINSNNNSTSVDIETEESLHKFISINIERNDILTIRTTENLAINNRTNITILIIYQHLNELYINGMINIQCINQIQTNLFRLHHHGTGSINLKLNVHSLDAYLHSIGRVKFCGQVLNETSIKSLSVGDVDCRKLLTRKMSIISSGIGNMYIMAIDEINITLSGIGIIYYSGPLKQQIQIGLGNIIALPNLFSLTDQEIINEDFD
jgi:hypothetical protein